MSEQPTNGTHSNGSPASPDAPTISNKMAKQKFGGKPRLKEKKDPATKPAKKEGAEPERKGPKEVPVSPKYIVKLGGTRGYAFPNEPPALDGRFIFYMEAPREVTSEEVEVEMQKPGRRWYAMDKAGFTLMQKHKVSTKEGEPWVTMPTYRDSANPTYWVGRRFEPAPPETPKIVISVGEMYLKSSFHQGAMYSSLISNIQRVTGARNVVHAGNTVEVRDIFPDEEAIQRIALLPGVAKVYKANLPVARMGDQLASGPGGIPILRDQTGLCLLSGGIDSPVAAYKMMCRGVNVRGVHFLNSTSEVGAIVDKNRRLGQQLSRIQGRFQLSFVDIGELQSQIVASVPNHNRTVLYKWFMLQIAAALDDSRILITGDSLGQVASQTIGNISTLYSTSRKAICAPLMGSNKSDIVDCARTIGTYKESIIQASDCCQYLMCKTGANTNIGVKSIKEALYKLKMPELSVTVETYTDGKLTNVERTSTFKPEDIGRGEELEIRETDRKSETYVYFDAAGSTRPHPEVQRAIATAPHGNPNSLHHTGRTARMAIEQVRTDFAQLLGKPAKDIIFTSGGTESNNIALNGYKVVRDSWSHSATKGGNNSQRGTALVIDLANHETGTINSNLKKPEGIDRLHVDACQGLCKVDFSTLDLSEVDSMAFSGHKINGPVGIGVLYIRDLDADPLMFGGAQEKGIRPGTENVPAICGFGAALHLDRSGTIARDVERYVIEQLREMGMPNNRGAETTGYVVHTTLPEGFVNHEVVAKLSTLHRVECGTGSACNSSVENTGVYDHLKINPAPVKRSLRFSWDFQVTMEEAVHAMMALRDVLGIRKVRSDLQEELEAAKATPLANGNGKHADPNGTSN